MSIGSFGSVNLNGMSTLSQMTGGMDYAQIIQALYQADLAPASQLNSVIQNDQLQINDWSNISNMANQVQNDLVNLTNDSSFNAFNTSTSGGAVSTVTAQTGAAPGSYTIKLKQAGTNASTSSSPSGGSTGVNGEVGAAISTSTLLSSSVFSQSISNGNVSFTYNGQSYSYTINDTQSLGTTLTNLTNLTGGAVSFAYNSSTNQINVTTTGAGSLVLGSSGDSSNFFQAVGLNGKSLATAGTVTSGLVSVAQLGQTLNNANLAGSLTNTTSGQLMINGVAINYNTSSDTLQSLIDNINGSTAGVVASYDPISDKIDLTSNSAQPITVSNKTGNIATILGLSGVSTAGTDWIYNVGTNSNLVSPSATVNNVIPGVSFTLASSAVTSSVSTVTVSQNTSALTNSINQFIGDFNNLYSEILKLTGKGGDLAGDAQLAQFGQQIMQDVLNVVPSAQSAGYAQNTVMGIGVSTGPIGSSPQTQYSLQLNSKTLTQAFAQDPNEVKSILTGMASTLNNDLTTYTGVTNSLTPTSEFASIGQGIIQDQQSLLNSDITNVEQQQTNIENQASTQEQNMANQFNALQQYEQQIAAQQTAIAALTGITYKG